jgi:hypothetical protein
MTPLKKLVDQFMWSCVGDVMKLVLSQKQIMQLLEEERKALHDAYMEGYWCAARGDSPDFEKFYDEKYEGNSEG